jgi:hypothetical protein
MGWGSRFIFYHWFSVFIWWLQLSGCLYSKVQQSLPQGCALQRGGGGGFYCSEHERRRNKQRFHTANTHTHTARAACQSHDVFKLSSSVGVAATLTMLRAC